MTDRTSGVDAVWRAHAAAFGELEGQTLDEAWTLIEAAVEATSLEGT